MRDLRSEVHSAEAQQLTWHAPQLGNCASTSHCFCFQCLCSLVAEQWTRSKNHILLQNNHLGRPRRMRHRPTCTMRGCSSPIGATTLEKQQAHFSIILWSNSGHSTPATRERFVTQERTRARIQPQLRWKLDRTMIRAE